MNEETHLTTENEEIAPSVAIACGILAGVVGLALVFAVLDEIFPGPPDDMTGSLYLVFAVLVGGMFGGMSGYLYSLIQRCKAAGVGFFFFILLCIGLQFLSMWDDIIRTHKFEPIVLCNPVLWWSLGLFWGGILSRRRAARKG